MQGRPIRVLNPSVDGYTEFCRELEQVRIRAFDLKVANASAVDSIRGLQGKFSPQPRDLDGVLAVLQDPVTAQASERQVHAILSAVGSRACPGVDELANLLWTRRYAPVRAYS